VGILRSDEIYPFVPRLFGVLIAKNIGPRVVLESGSMGLLPDVGSGVPWWSLVFLGDLAPGIWPRARTRSRPSTRSPRFPKDQAGDGLLEGSGRVVAGLQGAGMVALPACRHRL